MGAIFHEILYRPVLNFLVLVYDIIPGHDLGAAIVIVTILLRVVLHPLSLKSLKSQRALQELQPKIKEIQEKQKNKKEQGKQIMELYKTHKVNPLSSFLPLLLQIPILIVLYQVFLKGLTNGSLNSLYSFIHNPGVLNTISFGIVNVAEPNHTLAILAGVAQFFQAKTMFVKKDGTISGASKGPDISRMMSRQMTYVMPLFMVFIAWKLPAAIALYLITTTLFSLVEQALINRSAKN